jgi:PAS domain S-box-containing protein
MATDGLEFLAGGGQMGERMRAVDWSATALGPPASWPQSLKTCVRIVLTSRQPMFVWWGDALVNLYNDAYRSILGGKHPEALGQPASVVWREIWDQIVPRAEQALRGNEGTYDEALLLIMERNGYPEETYYTFSYSPVPKEGGGVGGIICANSEDTRRIVGERQTALLRDLAARTVHARRIEDAVARVATSLETDPHDLPFALLYLVEPDAKECRLVAGARIDRAHPAAVETLPLDEDGAWPVAEAIRTQREVVVSDLAARFGPLPTGAWSVPPTHAAVLPVAAWGPTGRAGILVVGLSPYRLLDDDYRGFLTLVTSQIGASIANAHAYEEERQRAEALEELDRAKTAFFSNVSHEFRTPLTLMLGPVEDALASAEGALAGDNLRTVHRNALRLLKLVNALLDFARIEAGRVNAVYRPTDLASLTADVASAFRSAVEKAGLAYRVDCEGPGEPVFVDHDMWEKIVLNLVSNALKFTFDGSIAVSLESRADHVELAVTDTGTGIPEDEVGRLFERFHRVEGSRARTHEGSGIGLALVQELVRLHGGTVRVESRVGAGSTFTVTIPSGRAHLPPERLGPAEGAPSTADVAVPFVQEALRWLPGVGGPENEGPAPGAEGSIDDEAFRDEPDAHVLLADDNADMREYVARLLRRRWSVETVGDGVAALAAARRRAPDLVLTDVMMPGLDGFGLLRELRESAATRAIPVIMLSARAGEESRVEGLRAGADDYLVKPFSARELVARVSTHLQIARLRQAAEHERQRLHEFLMQAPGAVAVIVGPELQFELANPAFCTMVDRADVAGKRVRDVFPELGESDLRHQLVRTMQTGEPYRTSESSVPLARAGILRERFFDIALTPMHESEPQTRRVIAVAVEVTERVQARKRIEGLRAAAEQANRAKDEFLGTLSHELRTPLNAILGWTTLIQSGNVEGPNLAKALDTIARNARVQVRLIEDLLDLSRIEQGKLVLAVGPVEMVRVVEAAMDAVRPAAEAKGVRLQPVLDSHATIVGDADRLQQIAWNLFSNAIKFTPRGGRVQVRLRRAQSSVELVVEDTGQGIGADFLPHVFDRFRQADPSSTRKAGGLGLGLAIVRSLVELHGGTVTAASEGLERGATFTVHLPIAPLRTNPATEPPPSPSGEPAPRTFECPPELRGARVLVVDDEPETRNLLEFLLSECGVRVTACANARDALRALEAGPFDALVSDVGMPDEDGHALIRKVRALPEAQGGRTPSVALTAYARTEDRTAAFRAGFDMHLAKPIDPAELVVVVARLMTRRSRPG